MDIDVLSQLTLKNDSRIVLFVLDGLGGLPDPDSGKTELETADTPNLDRLAREGICGLHVPVGAGITPGSGPAHMSLFGLDPLKYRVGRGAMSAMGVDFDLRSGDLAARGNFCSVDEEGNITDRRAGRISTEKNRELVERLSRRLDIKGMDVFVRTIKEHRFLLVLRGEGLVDDIEDIDPHATGVPPQEPRAKAGASAVAGPTIEALKSVMEQAATILSGESPANMILLRGFARRPDLPTTREAYGLRSAVLASYPMYRGLARLIGMEPVDTEEAVGAKITALSRHWSEYDFFFIHMKYTDSRGEDGDFQGRVRLIEEIDAQFPALINLGPDVLVVTGDHSTPAMMKSHSWHPVPVLLWGRDCRPDPVESFGESACLSGALGPRFPAHDLMSLALAHAGRLDKYGA